MSDIHIFTEIMWQSYFKTYLTEMVLYISARAEHLLRSTTNLLVNLLIKGRKTILKD